MKKVETLTPEQEAKIEVYRNKWLANGRKTTRIDQTKAIEAVKTIYRCAKIKEPEHLFFFPSPIQCQLAANIMKSEDFKNIFGEANLGANLRDNLRVNLGANLWANLRDNLWANLRANLGANLRVNLGANLGANLRDNLRDNLWANLGANLRANLWANLWANLGANIWANLGANLRAKLRDNLGANLRDNLGANLWANLWDNLGANLWANLGANLRDNLRDNLKNLKLEYQNIFFGSMWADWEGFYDYILNELFEKQISKHQDFVKYCQALQDVGLFIPYNGIVFISDNPISLKLSSNGRLHAENEPAMMYADGYSLFYMNGVRMPKWVIETEQDKLKSGEIMKLPNAEQRLLGIKKLGAHNMLKDLGAKSISKKDTEYELFEVNLEGSKEKLLRMKNPSEPKEHYEWVDPQIKTVNEALMWRIGWKIDKFKEPVAKT